jgi:NTP pyrophosphatase (non-canonical NTP hydrolase)
MKTNAEICQEILKEVFRAEAKHPHWPIDIIHACAIVNEESGELIRAALQYTYEGGDKKEIQKEAIQTAATCIRLLKNLE